MGNNKCFEQCPRCGYQETETENIMSIIPETEFPEKNLYLCCTRYGQEVVWYKMNPFNSTSTAQFSTISPICTGPEENRCSIVALGTKIYMIGGDYPYISEGGQRVTSNDIYSLDTCNDKSSSQQCPLVWQKESTHLLANRSFPTLVAAHGKIYVFGDYYSYPDLPKPFAEVFDPVLNVCARLPEPPREVTNGCLVSAVGNGDKILLTKERWSSSLSRELSLFSFDVISNSWSTISTKENIWGHGVVLDDIFFSYSLGRVNAFDMVKKKWLEVQGLDIASTSMRSPDGDPYCAHLVDIGNKLLSVVWSDFKGIGRYEVGSNQDCVRCLTFLITRDENSECGSYLRADVLAQSAYDLSSWGDLSKCFAL